MDQSAKLKGRYELRDALGRGGMGVVYRAYDGVLKCEVALKTLRQAPDPAELQLFYRECEVLVALNHPNIVQILDIGEFEEEGEKKPYFVMPLLPGMPLDKLIRNSGTQLTALRRVEILSQVCRGLHAAHDRGLIHRDIKPGNIFVMPDFSAVIIDFGVAHMTNTGATTAKGTLLYMAPELIEGKPPSPASDIFALGVVAYEMFTRRRPFERSGEREIVEALLHESPPAASEIDPNVSQSVSRVIHKALAKQPWNRFPSARDFGDCLEKAHRGEPIEYFDTARIRPRIERARAAFDEGDHQFATEILNDLESEGHLDPEISLLRKQVEIAIRQQRIRQLVDSARNRLRSDEYPLALQKVQEILQLEPDNADALGLKAKIESARSEGQIEGWIRLARQHIENNAFSHAREALQNVLQLQPRDTRATALMTEVSRLEKDYVQDRKEKEQLYQAAVEDYQKGEVSSALSKLARVLEMTRGTSDRTGREQGNAYQNFYNQVRSEHDAIQNAYAEAGKRLRDEDFPKAMAICEEYLAKYPGHVLFQSLKYDAQEQQRLRASSYIAEIDRRVEAETDFERKVNVVNEALERMPGEPHFERLARILRDRLDLINGIVAKARYYEDRGQFTEALGQWEILRTIHARYPGLQFETERVTKRRDQQSRTQAKARWVKQIDAHLDTGDFARAIETARSALEEYPDDGELLPLLQVATQSQQKCEEADRLQAEGEKLFDAGNFDEGLQALERAYDANRRNDAIRDSLVAHLVARAQRLVETDWRTADALVQRAQLLDPAHPGAKSVGSLLADLKKQDLLDQSIARVRQHQAAGEYQQAMGELEQMLSFYPTEPRLLQLRPSLEGKLREHGRQRDLQQIQGLAASVNFLSEPDDIRSVLELMQVIVSHYPGDRDFQAIIAEVELRPRTQTAIASRVSERATQMKPVPAATPAAVMEPPPPPPPVAPAAPPPPAEPPPAAATGSGAGLRDLLESLAAPPAAAPPAPEPPPAVPAAVEPVPPAPAAAAVPPEPPPSKASPAPVAAASPQPEEAAAAPAVEKAPVKPRSRRSPLVIVAAVVGLAVVAGGVWGFLEYQAAQKVPISFQIHATPAGAEVRLNGKTLGAAELPVQLSPGEYKLEVVKEGFEPATVAVVLKPRVTPSPINVVLKPRGQTLRVVSELSGVKFSLDGAALVSLPASGEISVSIPTLGPHKLEVQAGATRSVFAFQTAAAAPPVVQKPAVGAGVVAVIVGSLKDKAQIQSSMGGVAVHIGDRTAGILGDAGLPLANLIPGPLPLTLGAGESRWNGQVEIGPENAVTAFLSALVRPSSIVVRTVGADGVNINIDGSSKGVTQDEILRINVTAGMHEVRADKDGFLPTTPQQVKVEKGMQSNVAFLLVRRPVAAAVPAKVEAPLHGRVQLASSPTAVQITFSRKGESASRPASLGITELDEGDYVFTAKAAGFVDSSIPVSVVAGAVQTVNFNLTPVEAPAPKVAAPVVRTMNDADWDKPWDKEGGWFTRKSGGMVLYNVTPAVGVFQFVLRATGKIRWVVRYTGQDSYLLCELDNQSYTTTEFAAGKKTVKAEKKKLGLKLGTYPLRITIEPNRLATDLQQDSGWMQLDDSRRTDNFFTEGKFGFFPISQMWLANFSFKPKQ